MTPAIATDVEISIVVPVYREERNIPEFVRRMQSIMQTVTPRYEIIFAMDPSPDRTEMVILDLRKADPRIKLIKFSRRFGQPMATLAGMQHSSGAAVIVMDVDLQDPPELIPEFVRQWEEGFEVVVGVLQKRRDYRLLKTIGAKIAYWLIYTLSDCKIPPNATDFRLFDRKVVDALKILREPDRYLRGLVHWIGFRRSYVSYDRAPRHSGRSTAGLWYSVRFAVNAILSFSAKPLRLATILGGFVAAASFAYALFAFAVHLLHLSFVPVPPRGILTIILLISFFIGFNTLFLGIIGEYLGRIYNQGKNRPLYLVDEQLNFDATTKSGSKRSSVPVPR
jgi:dolichol-phosphate mannosyltransferase